MDQRFLLNPLSLPEALVRDLRRMNPWWENRPQAPLPRTRRHLVGAIHRRMQKRLAPIVAVRGPRQIGKTIAQRQVLQDLLDAGAPPTSILRVQADELPALTRVEEPLLRIVDWYEQSVLHESANEAAARGQKVHLFFDEVQNLADWAPQLKSLVDHSAVQVVLTGSSALRIELGRDSLAGRITTIEAGVLSLTEIGAFHDIPVGEPALADNGLEALLDREFWLSLARRGRELGASRDNAFRRFSARGAYPLAHRADDASWSDLAAQLNENVIQRVIQHDLRIGERGRRRDAQLLEELFRLCCRYVGQSPSHEMLAREVHRSLSANVGAQRVNHYLRFLGDTLLVRLVEPLEIRLKRRRGSAKICLADHSLRASWLHEITPIDPNALQREPHLTALAGRIAESVAGAALSTIHGLGLAHLPERPDQPEVDFVAVEGTKRIPIEVKYQRKIDPLADTEGLRTFIEKRDNNAPFGILVTQTDVEPLPDQRIVALPLSSLMLLR